MPVTTILPARSGWRSRDDVPGMGALKQEHLAGIGMVGLEEPQDFRRIYDAQYFLFHRRDVVAGFAGGQHARRLSGVVSFEQNDPARQQIEMLPSEPLGIMRLRNPVCAPTVASRIRLFNSRLVSSTSR